LYDKMLAWHLFPMNPAFPRFAILAILSHLRSSAGPREMEAHDVIVREHLRPRSSSHFSSEPIYEALAVL